jgi:hypothetical protein
VDGALGASLGPRGEVKRPNHSGAQPKGSSEPPAATVTLTVSVQVSPPGIERPAGKGTVEAPATAIGAPTPPQVVPAIGAAAITSPLGNVSMSGSVRVASAASGLLKVMMSALTAERTATF